MYGIKFTQMSAHDTRLFSARSHARRAGSTARDAAAARPSAGRGARLLGLSRCFDQKHPECTAPPGVIAARLWRADGLVIELVSFLFSHLNKHKNVVQHWLLNFRVSTPPNPIGIPVVVVFLKIYLIWFVFIPFNLNFS